MKTKLEVVRRTITLPKKIDAILTKQAIRKGMKTPTYFNRLLCEFAEPE